MCAENAIGFARAMGAVGTVFDVEVFADAVEAMYLVVGEAGVGPRGYAPQHDVIQLEMIQQILDVVGVGLKDVQVVEIGVMGAAKTT